MDPGFFPLPSPSHDGEGKELVAQLEKTLSQRHLSP